MASVEVKLWVSGPSFVRGWPKVHSFEDEPYLERPHVGTLTLVKTDESLKSATKQSALGAAVAQPVRFGAMERTSLQW